MRFLTRLLLAIPAVAAVPAFAGTAHAQAYSPFLDGLREEVAALAAAEPPPDARSAAALARAATALDLPSESMREDLAHLLRAVAVLQPALGGDAGLREEVHRCLYLFEHRIDAEYERIRAAGMGTSSLSNAASRRVAACLNGVRKALETEGLRVDSWKSIVRRLARASAFAERGAAALGWEAGTSFVQGSITATVGGEERTWTFASALYQPADPSDSNSDPELSLIAFSTGPLSRFRVLGCRIVGQVVVLDGIMDVADYPSEGTFHPAESSRRLVEDPEPPAGSFVLDAVDPEAGTASGTFVLDMIDTYGSGTAAVSGTFEITGGLLSY